MAYSHIACLIGDCSMDQEEDDRSHGVILKVSMFVEWLNPSVLVDGHAWWRGWSRQPREPCRNFAGEEGAKEGET